MCKHSIWLIYRSRLIYIVCFHDQSLYVLPTNIVGVVYVLCVFLSISLHLLIDLIYSVQYTVTIYSPYFTQTKCKIV